WSGDGPLTRLVLPRRVARGSRDLERGEGTGGGGPSSHHLARVHQPARVERVLDREHQAAVEGGAIVPELVALELPDPVLGADAAFERRDDVVHGAPDARVQFGGDARLAVVPWHDVQVQAAIAEVPEQDDPGTGQRRLDRAA